MVRDHNSCVTITPPSGGHCRVAMVTSSAASASSTVGRSTRAVWRSRTRSSALAPSPSCTWVRAQSATHITLCAQRSLLSPGHITGCAPVVDIHKQGLHIRALTDCRCAVKMLPDYADFHAKVDFIHEINFMKARGVHRHRVVVCNVVTDAAVSQDLGYYKHLVNLIACVTVDDPLCLITEFCDKGDLLHLVRQEKQAIEKVSAQLCFL